MSRPLGPLPASAPVRVARWLQDAEPGPLPVLHRGAAAVYVVVTVAGRPRCLGLVGTAAAAVPCALRLATPTLAGLAHAEPTLSDGRLHLDGRPLAVGRRVDPRVPPVPPHLAALADPPTPPLAELAGLPDPVDGDAALGLLGRGNGLTPLGDDVVCGWLAWHVAAGVATPELADALAAAGERTTLLSATLLACAAEGEVVPEFAAWVRSVGTPGEQDATGALVALGHTSGAGLWYGAQRARHHLHRTRHRKLPPRRTSRSTTTKAVA